MPLKKNKYPVLEFDTDSKAVIMPNRHRLYKLPSKCVFAFLENTIEKYVKKNRLRKIAEFVSVTKKFPIFETKYKGERICLVHAPCGSSAATQILDFIICYGSKYVIACGCCGVLEDIKENEFLIPTSALRAEGTSYQYLKPSREIDLEKKGIKAIEKACKVFGVNAIKCKTWTTDGFYRETRKMIEYRKKEGCLTVEMECSALAACAKMRQAHFGQILFSADTLAKVECHDERGWGGSSHEKAFLLSLEAVYHYDK